MSLPGAKKEAIIVAMTGASGVIYGLRLIQRLAEAGIFIHLLLSRASRIVLKQEIDLDLPIAPEDSATALTHYLGIAKHPIKCYGLEDWFSPAASGSAGIKQMVIIPCSMGTLARIAIGASDNLIERAADVILKENRQLILMPRETPLSTIHLENMLKLARMGAHIIPAMPGFYHRPQSLDDIVDFLVNRILDHLEIPNSEAQQWGI
jgi:4-hydroxy-3-polyprenylbenzoate decarboxylase